MSAFSVLGWREFRVNWRRNAVFGSILFIAVATQLATALADQASRVAVETYGVAVYGYPQTYSGQSSVRLDPAGLARLNRELSGVTAAHPWFRAATAVEVPIALDATGKQDPRTAVQVGAKAVSPGWRELSPALPDGDVWRTVVDPDRLGVAMLLDAGAAARLQVSGPATVSLFDEAAPEGGTASAGTAGSSASAGAGSVAGGGAEGGEASGSATDGASGANPDAPVERAGGSVGPARVLHDIPVFGIYQELNKSLSADALVNQNILSLLGMGPQAVSIYWRCEPARCQDASRLVALALLPVGADVVGTVRLDQTDQFAPVLEQQSRNGSRLAVIVLVLGALAVTVVSTAFVEVRAPQFATLRTLGASRSGVAGIALLENLLTALVIAVLAVIVGLVATRLDPNRFNQIQQIRLSSMEVPVGVLLRTVLLTLGVGLLTGLSPALRAYRSVRTS